MFSGRRGVFSVKFRRVSLSVSVSLFPQQIVWTRESYKVLNYTSCIDIILCTLFADDDIGGKEYRHKNRDDVSLSLSFYLVHDCDIINVRLVRLPYA